MLAGATYGIAMLRGTHSLATFEEKRKQIDQLEKENQALHREIAARQNHLDVITKNPDELKLEIQKRLKLLAPGTKQFILQDGTASPAEDPQQ